MGVMLILFSSVKVFLLFLVLIMLMFSWFSDCDMVVCRLLLFFISRMMWLLCLLGLMGICGGVLGMVGCRCVGVMGSFIEK